MKDKLLVIGSFNFDHFYYVDKLPLPGETVDAYETKLTFGGKGFNQAVAAAKVSNITEFLCIYGNDFMKKYERYIVDNYGIATCFCKSINNKTGEAHIVVDKEGNNQIVVIGGANKFFNDDFANSLVNVYKRYSAVLLQNELNEKFTDYLFKYYGKEKTVFYNAAPAKKIEDEYYQCIDYLFVNELELKQLTGCDELDDGIKKLLSKGVKNVIVTLGKDGVLFVSKTERIKKLAINVKAVDTVGAGDTFVGYFVGAIMQGMSHQKAMDLAVTAAGLSTTKKGSADAIPTLEEVLAYC